MRVFLFAAYALVALIAIGAHAGDIDDFNGFALLPNAVSTSSAGGRHVMQNGVDVGRVASRIDAVLTSVYTNATVTPSTILTVTLPIATLHCRGRVNGTDSTAADGVSIVFNTAGLTASASSSTTGDIVTTAPLESPVVVTASGASTTLAVATFGTGFVDFDSVLTVTTGGSLVISGAQNAHTTGTLTINKGSYVICEPL